MKPNAFATALCATLIGGVTVLFAADAPKPKGPTTKPATTQAKAKTPVNKFCAVEGKGHDIFLRTAWGEGARIAHREHGTGGEHHTV
jgi:hypothetical protein